MIPLEDFQIMPSGKYDAGGGCFFKENIAFKFSSVGAPLCEFYILWGCKQGLCLQEAHSHPPLRFPSFLVKIVLRPPFQKGIMSKISLRRVRRKCAICMQNWRP